MPPVDSSVSSPLARFAMLLGYNTNGLAHHDPLDAIELLAEIGYKSVAVTIDHNTLNPYRDDFRRQVVQTGRLFERHGMRSVVETGARFLLDPRSKHEPTLMTADPEARSKRVEFLERAIDAAKLLGSDCVSFWSGAARDGVCDEEGFERLVNGLRRVIDAAAEQGVTLGFEVEPGMFIDTMDRYGQLLERIDAPHFLMTLDVGHLHCQGEVPIAEYIRRWAARLVNVHIEDMRAGQHEHLMFDEGQMRFPPIIDALAEVGYQGALHVELSRHSHEGPSAARRAFALLKPLIDKD